MKAQAGLVPAPCTARQAPAGGADRPGQQASATLPSRRLPRSRPHRSGAGRAGASASWVGSGAQSALEVRDADDHLLFRFEPESGRTVVGVPAGDLAIRIPDGQLQVDAARGLHLRTSAFSCEAQAGALRFAKLEIVAGRLIERAHHAYRRITHLAELQAGRMRTLVEGLWHCKAGESTLKATGTLQLDGDRIELG